MLANFECETLFRLLALPCVMSILDCACTALFYFDAAECFLAFGDWDRKPGGFM